MKFVVVLVLAISAVSARPADSEIDWANVVPVSNLLQSAAFKPIYQESSVQRDRRIVNGQTAGPHQFPYQVSY